MKEESPSTVPDGIDTLRRMDAPAIQYGTFFHDLLGLPKSTSEQVIRDNPPKMFTIGRKRYIMRDDAIRWLEEQARNNPYLPPKNRGNAA